MSLSRLKSISMSLLNNQSELKILFNKMDSSQNSGIPPKHEVSRFEFVFDGRYAEQILAEVAELEEDDAPILNRPMLAAA